MNWKFVTSDGKVLYENIKSTYENGFAGFWLPRDIEGTIYVTYDGYEGIQNFDTYSNSDTCITTLKLN